MQCPKCKSKLKVSYGNNYGIANCLTCGYTLQGTRNKVRKKLVKQGG